MAFIIKYTKPNGESGQVSAADENAIQGKLDEIGPCWVEIKEEE
tara:strand:- start:102 stop:233 length:132 start_codon:yes stop_codon:yes gene_type:complete